MTKSAGNVRSLTRMSTIRCARYSLALPHEKKMWNDLQDRDNVLHGTMTLEVKHLNKDVSLHAVAGSAAQMALPMAQGRTRDQAGIQIASAALQSSKVLKKFTLLHPASDFTMDILNSAISL